MSKMFFYRLDKGELPITADKRLRYASPKLPSVTSFIRKTLYAIVDEWFNSYHINNNQKDVEKHFNEWISISL
jgi:hypothetical protein